jgi:acetoin utilization deacetylase AcuC-like enzyme
MRSRPVRVPPSDGPSSRAPSRLRSLSLKSVLTSMCAGAGARNADASQISRVAIVDFDVHHGNGTAHIAARRAAHRREQGLELDLLYCSTHEHPLYPMTGAADTEATDADAVQNFELESGADSAVWRRVYENDVLPRLRRFEPDMIVISAGFDAHSADPLGSVELTSEDFEWVTRELLRCCDGRAVSVLEGGYDIDSLLECVVGHVQAMQQWRS